MPSNQIDLTLDARKLAKHLTVEVEATVKGMFWIRLGFLVIRLGCWIAGTQYKEE